MYLARWVSRFIVLASSGLALSQEPRKMRYMLRSPVITEPPL